MPGFYSIYSQMFPPKPMFTGSDLTDLHSKVYIVTGSNTGVGKELAQILYSKNAKVYVAARSEDKSRNAIEAIKKAEPNSKGELVFLKLDLADLSKIKASAEEFLSKETQLHVLFNNAGIQSHIKGQKSPQGHELQLAVNNIGTFMFTKLLTPLLSTTAKKEPSGTVRVVWVSSAGAELGSPPGGIDLSNLDFHNEIAPLMQYSVTKAGNYLQSTEFAKRYKNDGIVSVALNPGNLQSDLYRDASWFFKLLTRFMLYPPVFGAYTELFAGLSPVITMEKTGTWVVPWGRFMAIRDDLVAASKTEAEGGTGIAAKFWEWNEDQIKSFL